jgi:MFS family permease
LLASIAVSALGTWSYNVAIAVYAYQETQSTAWVAAATVGRYIPAVLITLAGSRLVDRYPRRTVAVVADCVCAVVMLALALVANAHGSLVLAIALAAVSSGTARIQSSAALSFAADLVVESQLARTAVLISTVEAVATAAGPALASAVLAVAGPPAVFLLNGVTFLVSAGLVASVRPLRLRRTVPTATGSGTREVGLAAAVRATWPLLASRTVSSFVYGADIVLLAVVATQTMNQGTTAYGWLLAAAGVGGLVAAGVLRRQEPVGAAAGRSTIGVLLYSLPLLVFLAAPTLGEGLVAQVVRGFGCVLASATIVAGLQSIVPSVVAGRVFGLAHVLVLVGTCAGALTVPVLLNAWGLDATLVVLAVGPAMVQLALLPGLVGYDRRSSGLLSSLDPRVDLLRRLSLLSDASRATLYELADDVEEHAVAPGRPVVVEGEEADAFWVLVAGTVSVSAYTPDGPRHLRDLAGPDYFGEIGLLNQSPRTATVTTSSPCTLWRVPAGTFLGALAEAGLSSALTDTVRLRLTSE